MGIAHQHHDECAIAYGEIAHDVQHRLLLRADDVGRSNELRRAAKLSARARCGDLRQGFAAPHQRTCEGVHTGTRFDGYRFARQHRLIEQHLAIDQSDVGGDDAAE